MTHKIILQTRQNIVERGNRLIHMPYL